jgi:hypothetical protein
MNKVHIFELEPYLPFIEIKDGVLTQSEGNTFKKLASFDSNLEELIQQNQIELVQSLEEVNNQLPEWVQVQIEQGLLGELIAERYLKSIYKNVENVSKDSRLGFDIRVNDKCFEVKTSLNKNAFHVTFNELKVANEKQDNYFIFFIRLSKKEKSAKGYIIQNPIATFEINFIEITNVINLTNVFITPCQFIISLKDEYLDDIQEINLNDFIY